MFRQKPRDNKIIPDRLMPDNWNMENKILKFSAFFIWYVQITFSKKNPAEPNQKHQIHNNVQTKLTKPPKMCKLAAYF